MPRIDLESIDDPRIGLYRDLPKSRPDHRAGMFIAEGHLLVDRLLVSSFDVESVLVEHRLADDYAAKLSREVPVYAATKKQVEQIIGFNFHRGVLACGRRRPSVTLDEVLPRGASRQTIVVCVDVKDPENLGGILRNSAAFGVDAVLIGGQCADPFSRRVLRVSMGAVLKLPLVDSTDLAAELRTLRDIQAVQLAAAVLNTGAEPLESAERPVRLAILFGNEGHGLAQHWLELCDRQITIPMRRGTDSLNVSVAAGIFLFHFIRDAT